LLSGYPSQYAVPYSSYYTSSNKPKFIAYTLLTALYNLTLHPLASYPGPLLWRLSPIPSIISLLRGRLAFDYKVHHDKYGPVVRIMPNELSFNTARAWDDIYGHRVGLANMDKDPIHVGAVEAIPGANLTMAPGEHHARQRRALAHAFSRQALLEQEPILRGYVDLFVTRLRELARKGEPANMASWFNFCTFDIIGDLSFGEPFGCLREGVFFHVTNPNREIANTTSMTRRWQRIRQLGRPNLRSDQIRGH
jgi:cytochrome P450